VEEAEHRKIAGSLPLEIDEIVGLQTSFGYGCEVIHEEDQYSNLFLIAAAFILILMILASVFESMATRLCYVFCSAAASGSFWH
jgi:hypothetical protein